MGNQWWEAEIIFRQLRLQLVRKNEAIVLRNMLVESGFANGLISILQATATLTNRKDALNTVYQWLQKQDLGTQKLSVCDQIWDMLFPILINNNRARNLDSSYCAKNHEHSSNSGQHRRLTPVSTISSGVGHSAAHDNQLQHQCNPSVSAIDGMGSGTQDNQPAGIGRFNQHLVSHNNSDIHSPHNPQSSNAASTAKIRHTTSPVTRCHPLDSEQHNQLPQYISRYPLHNASGSEHGSNQAVEPWWKANSILSSLRLRLIRMPNMRSFCQLLDNRDFALRFLSRIENAAKAPSPQQGQNDIYQWLLIQKNHLSSPDLLEPIDEVWAIMQPMLQCYAEAIIAKQKNHNNRPPQTISLPKKTMYRTDQQRKASEFETIIDQAVDNIINSFGKRTIVHHAKEFEPVPK